MPSSTSVMEEALLDGFPTSERCPRRSAWRAVSLAKDLRQAGETAGICVHSGLIVEVLHRIGDKRRNPKLLLVENAPFVLSLNRVAAVMQLSERVCAHRLMATTDSD
jgi:hypothetical protein